MIVHARADVSAAQHSYHSLFFFLEWGEPSDKVGDSAGKANP